MTLPTRCSFNIFSLNGSEGCTGCVVMNQWLKDQSHFLCWTFHFTIQCSAIFVAKKDVMWHTDLLSPMAILGGATI